MLTVCFVGVALLAGGATAAGASDGDPAEFDDGEELPMDEYGDANESAGVAADIRATSDHTTVALVASAQGQPAGGAVPSEGTLDIWAGVFEDDEIPAVLPDEEVTVTVDRPDGETETFTEMTDAGGSVSLAYDLSDPDREPGTYELTVEHEEAGTASDQFEVGTSVNIAAPSFEPQLVDREIEFPVAARDGETPEVGLDLDIVIEEDFDPVLEETVTTDEDGFASVTFTPTDPDASYTMTVERDGEEVANVFFDAVEAYAVGDFGLDEAAVGDGNFYGGYVVGPDGPMANEELAVEMFDDPFDAEPIVFVEENVTTDEHGFFGFEYEIDDPRATDPFSIDVEVETVDGTAVALDRSTVSVNERDPPVDDDIPDDEASLGASFEEFTYAPGETAELTISAADADGEPITDESVDLFVRYEFNGPPFATDSVTLDADGQATVEVSIPENAPDGSDLRGEVALEHDGELLTATGFADLQALALSFPFDTIEPGEENTVEFDATDRVTGEAVEGIFRQFDYQYPGPTGGTFASFGLETDADGTAETTIEIPEDIGLELDVGLWDRYFDVFNFPQPLEVDHPGDISLPDEVEPGEEFEVTVDADGADLSGIVFGSTPFSPRQTIGATLDGEETVSMTVPDTAASGGMVVTLWAADDDGTLHVANEFVFVEQPVEANFGFDPAEPDLGEEVTFDASTSVSADGDIVEYRWDFTGDGDIDETTDDPVTTRTYEAPGAVSASLEVEDEEGQTSIVRRSVMIQAPEEVSVTLDRDFDVVVSGQDLAPYNVTVENIGLEPETQLLEFTVEDAAGNLVFLDEEQVTVEGESEKLVTFEVPSDDADQIPPGFYDVEVTAEESADDDELFVAAAEGTFFEVDSLEAPDTGFDGFDIPVSATVTNLGATDGTQNVTLRLNETGEPLDEDAIVATEMPTLASGADTTVEFSVAAPESGDYVHGMFSQNDSETADIQIEEYDGPGDVTGDGSPAQDLNNDGLFEDVDGDGTFDIFDVQALFDNLDSDAVQNNAAAFDFSGLDPDEVTIFDVQALFNRLVDWDGPN